MRTMDYSVGDIVAVPFPFVDGPDVKRRPAVVLSNGEFNAAHEHVVLAMITTAKRSAWPSDIRISDHAAVGLPVPSVIRMKIFTLDARLIARRLGRLSSVDMRAFHRTLSTNVLTMTDH